MLTSTGSGKTSCSFQRSTFISQLRLNAASCRSRFLSWKQNCQNPNAKSRTAKINPLSGTKSKLFSVSVSEVPVSGLMFSLVGFVLISLCVFSGNSSNFLLVCDQWIHEWVQFHVSPRLQTTLFQHWISDFFIEFNITFGAILLLIISLLDVKKGFIVTSLTSFFFITGTGSHRFEGTLLHYLKLLFQRPRPHLGMKAYSFPSGHVFASTFLTRIVFYNLLPIANRLLDQSGKTPKLFKILEEKNELIVNVSILMTMIGRIGADVHWFSDTLASVCLGTVLSILFTNLLSYTFIPDKQKPKV